MVIKIHFILGKSGELYEVSLHTKCKENRKVFPYEQGIKSGKRDCVEGLNGTHQSSVYNL